jgi:putative phage-type endonuclease
MGSFEKVDVTPDTPQWEAERRHSVGASEAAAVLGMSAYGTTPLDVYKSKLGVDRRFDPLLAWIGHQSEPIIHKWVEEFSGVDVHLEPGFMARSVEWPFLHASFDRVSYQPFITWQFKTAHQYAGHHWDEGIPTDIRVQVQAEMAVAGTTRAAVVVWIGGRDFRLFWEPRDDRFITEHLIPTVMEFWDANVRAQVPPAVSSLAEVNAIVTDGTETDLNDAAFDTLERITVLNSDIQAQEAERDALKVALAQYVGTADVLMYDGRKVATWKQQKGRQGFDLPGLRAVHPEIVNEFTTIGQPFRVLRRTKMKEHAA